MYEADRSRELPRRTATRPAILAVLVLLAWLAACPRAAALQVGDRAPDFTLPYATADTIVFHGEPLHDAVKRGIVVLAFYPADWSPGCTKEVCTLRDSFDDFAKLKVTVWAISGDQVFSHRAWAEQQHLPFRLLSDTKHKVAEAYGVFDEERGQNQRSVFVVGSGGKILYADPDYSVKDEADFQALQRELARLSGTGGGS